MLKIWGRNNSVNVIKVLWCAAELGLDFDRADIGGLSAAMINRSILPRTRWAGSRRSKTAI